MSLATTAATWTMDDIPPPVASKKRQSTVRTATEMIGVSGSSAFESERHLPKLQADRPNASDEGHGLLKIQENNDLNMQTPVSSGTSSSPSLSVNNSSTSAPDQTVTSTATTRDDTAILDFVLNRSKSRV